MLLRRLVGLLVPMPGRGTETETATATAPAAVAVAVLSHPTQCPIATRSGQAQRPSTTERETEKEACIESDSAAHGAAPTHRRTSLQSRDGRAAPLDFLLVLLARLLLEELGRRAREVGMSEIAIAIEI